MLVDDDVIEFSDREMDNVVMSLDGRKEVNDRFRKTAGGVGSFDVIVPKFRKFAAARGEKEYYIRGTFTHYNPRGTFTHYNPDFMKDIDTMLGLGLGFTRLSMEPVVAPPDSPCALTEKDKQIVMEQYELLAKRMIEMRRKGTPFVFYHYMLDLEHGPCIYKRISGCGSGTEYMAVTPTGELYPCHQFVGEERFRMGDIFGGVSEEGKKIRDEFRRCNAYSKPECDDCWARLRERMARRRRCQRRVFLRMRPLPLPHGVRARRQSFRSPRRSEITPQVLPRICALSCASAQYLIFPKIGGENRRSCFIII